MLQNSLSLPRPEEFVATTPADLRAARMLLGLTRVELGELLGVKDDEIRNLERGRTLFIHRGHAALLESMIERVNGMLADNTADHVPAPDFLFCYSNNEVFQEMEPKLAAWMRFSSVHQMYLARLMDEWMQAGHRPIMMELVLSQYREFIDGRGGKDTEEQRCAWARAHIASITSRPGVPKNEYKGQIKFETKGYLNEGEE